MRSKHCPICVIDGAQVRGSALVSDNAARVDGGAFHLRNTTVTMTIESSNNKAGSKGGSLYVKNARLFMQGTFGFDPISNTRSNNLWIDDDNNPSDNGSFVSRFSDYPLDIEEVANGPDQTQKFSSTDCKQ
jgi:hypothetical protein